MISLGSQMIQPDSSRKFDLFFFFGFDWFIYKFLDIGLSKDVSKLKRIKILTLIK